MSLDALMIEMLDPTQGAINRILSASNCASGKAFLTDTIENCTGIRICVNPAISTSIHNEVNMFRYCESSSRYCVLTKRADVE